MVDIELQLRELSDIAWKHILETVVYHCDPDDLETISSEFDREVDNHYYSIKEKFEKISDLLKEW
jgi:ppGpp synthetase/RelA/SpoT-type nucleotidyltranferase